MAEGEEVPPLASNIQSIHSIAQPYAKLHRHAPRARTTIMHDKTCLKEILSFTFDPPTSFARLRGNVCKLRTENIITASIFIGGYWSAQHAHFHSI